MFGSRRRSRSLDPEGYFGWLEQGNDGKGSDKEQLDGLKRMAQGFKDSKLPLEEQFTKVEDAEEQRHSLDSGLSYFTRGRKEEAKVDPVKTPLQQNRGQNEKRWVIDIEFLPQSPSRATDSARPNPSRDNIEASSATSSSNPSVVPRSDSTSQSKSSSSVNPHLETVISGHTLRDILASPLFTRGHPDRIRSYIDEVKRLGEVKEGSTESQELEAVWEEIRSMERVLKERRRASSPLSATPTPSERLQTISTTTDGSKERRSTFLHDFFEEPAREKLGEEVMELNVRSRRVLGEEEKVKLLERVRRGAFVPDIIAGEMPAASNSSIPTLDPDFATTTSIPTSPFLTREAALDPDFATTTTIPAQESSPKMEKNVAMDNISTFDPDIATSSLLAGSRSIPASTSLPRDPRQYLSLLSSTELALDSYPHVAKVLASLQLSTQIEDWSEEERKTVRAQVGEKEWLLIDGKDTLPLVSSSQTGGEVSESKMVQEGVRKSSFLDSFYDQPDNPPIASSSASRPPAVVTPPEAFLPFLRTTTLALSSHTRVSKLLSKHGLDPGTLKEMSTKDLENSGLLQRGLRLEELVKLSQRRAEGDELRESEEERLLREEEEHKTGCGHKHQHSGPSSNPEEHVAASSGEPSIGESEQKPRKRLPDSSSPDNPSPINDYLFGDAAPLPKKEASFPHFDESNATTTAERSMAYGNQLRNEALQSLHAQIRELEEKEAKERLQTTIPKEEGKPEERVEEPSVKLDAETTRSAPPDETSPWFASFFKGASEQKISPHSGATQSQIENGFRESVSWSDRIKRSAQAMEERHGSIGRLIAEKALEAEAKHRLTPQEKEQFQLLSEEQGRHVRPPVGSSSNLPWSVRCMMKAKSTPMPPRAQLARTAVNIMANGGRLASRRKVVPLKRLAPKEKASSSQSQKEETGCTIM